MGVTKRFRGESSSNVSDFGRLLCHVSEEGRVRMRPCIRVNNLNILLIVNHKFLQEIEKEKGERTIISYVYYKKVSLQL